MISLFGNSIRHKVTTAILATSFVTLAVTLGFLILFEWRNSESELIERMNTAGRIVRANVTAAVAFKTVDEAQEMLSSLQTDRDIIGAALYEENGDLMASYARPESAFQPPAKAPEIGAIETAEALVLALAIESDDDRIGTLLLASGFDSRNRRFALYLATAGGMFVLAIGAAVFLSRALEERISMPILSLVETTRRVTTERDYSVRVSPTNTTEVDKLADAFNRMLNEVNQREEQLTQAMDRLRLTLEASKTYTWEWNRAYNRFVWHSSNQLPAALQRLEGKRPDEILLMVHPKDHYSVREAFKSAVVGQGEFQFDLQLHPGGEGDKVEVACQGRAFRDETGQIARAVGVASDVTQRRRTERELYWREQEFRALIEHSPDIIARYDRDLRVLYVSPAALAYTGQEPEAIVGKTLQEIGVSEERIAVWRSAIESIYAGAPHAEIEFDYKHPSGVTRFFLARLVPERAPSGEVEYVLAVSREITDRKRYETDLREAKEKAEAAAQAKSVFLSNMSHDIRTPLTTILGCAELLKAQGDPESQEIVDMVKSGGKRLLDILNSVLDLAQLEGGEAELKFEAVDVRSELEEIVRLFRVRAEAKSLQLDFDAPIDPVMGRIDKAAFSRVMMNVLGNAIKFTSEGSITVKLWGERQRFFVSVEDTGPGIPPEVLPKIFDAFTRSRQSEIKKAEGSGLGMTITKQLVRLMDGDISVSSSVGQGSIFTIELGQAGAESANEQVAASKARESLSAKRCSILAVEDNINTVRMLELMLAKRYDAVVVTTGKEALERARNERFDAVLMDIGLETPDAGVGYMRALRNLESYQGTPIIAFTAHALPGEADRFREIGFDDYLGKPFTSESLESVLDRCIAAT